MNRLINTLFAVAALAAAASPLASLADESNTVIVGNVYHPAGVVLVCADKKDAIEALEAEDVSAAFVKKQEEAKCRGFFDYVRVGNVVFVRNIDDKFYKVVEVSHPEDESRKLYWVTSNNVLKGGRSV